MVLVGAADEEQEDEGGHGQEEAQQLLLRDPAALEGGGGGGSGDSFASRMEAAVLEASNSPFFGGNVGTMGRGRGRGLGPPTNSKHIPQGTEFLVLVANRVHFSQCYVYFYLFMFILNTFAIVWVSLKVGGSSLKVGGSRLRRLDGLWPCGCGFRRLCLLMVVMRPRDFPSVLFVQVLVEGRSSSKAFLALEMVISFILFLEVTIRLISLRRKYFTSLANIFDLVRCDGVGGRRSSSRGGVKRGVGQGAPSRSSSTLMTVMVNAVQQECEAPRGASAAATVLPWCRGCCRHCESHFGRVGAGCAF